MLKENRTIGRSGKVFDNLGSNSTLNNLLFIRRTMQGRKPAGTLEIGLAFGASTLVFAWDDRERSNIPLSTPYSPIASLMKPVSMR
jgi:hypothetical protein